VKINLLNKKDIITAALSHGEKQWLEIGMVLAQSPDIITLDEPTSGMTANETYKTGEMIKNLMKDETVVVIEHDIDFVKQIAETITVLHQGRILAEGDYEAITSDPEVVRVYLKTGEEVESDALCGIRVG
jgi:urea transport system ATP-binding protein